MTLPTPLVGDDLEVPCIDGTAAPLPEPRRRGLHERAPRSRRPGARLRPLVLERAPRRGLQVAHRDRRVRAGARRVPPLRGPPIRRRRRDHLPQHDRGDQPPRVPAPSDRRRRRGHHRGRAPRQPAAVGAGCAAPLRRMRARRHLRCRRRDRRARRRSSSPPPRDHRRVQRHRMDARAPDIAAAAHARGIPVFVDAAQLAPHRPIPAEVDYVAWSGHKMYAPFGSGVLVGPRSTFDRRRPVPRRRRCGRPRRPRRGGLDRSART